MGGWRERWTGAVWGTLGFLMFLGGFLSENTVTMVVGVTLAFAGTSAHLTSYVRTEKRVKKCLEVFFALVALVIPIYGYVVTGSLVLGVITLFIVTMLFVAFILSYLLPKIRANSRKANDARNIG